jgi:hypothetical protein
MDRKLELARKIAKEKNLKYETLQPSTRENKRFSITNDHGKRIHFGLWPYNDGTFLDHKNPIKRAAWYKRHFSDSEKNKKIKKDQSPLYFSALILW